MSRQLERRCGERIYSGYLTYIEGQKNHKRWVILEKVVNGSNNSYQLCLYKDDTEKYDKKSKILYIHGHDFVGTEQGRVKTNKRESIAYFAVILTEETIMFQSSVIEELSIWHRKFKQYVQHRSWLIYPKEGFPDSDTDCRKKTLHVTQSSVCLAHLNPPRFYKRWNLDRIKRVHCNTDVMGLEIKDSGFFLFSAEKPHYLQRIKDAIDNMVKGNESNIDERPPLPTPAPTDSIPEQDNNHHGDEISDTENDGLDSYVNIYNGDNYNNVPLPPTPLPPARPIKDCFRHFRSDSIEETVYAIRSNKVCYKDSLQMPPSQRQTLFVYSDAHGWWKELAEEIGLDYSAIDIVQSLAPQLNKFCTEILIYHWECMKDPVRECSMEELKKIAIELKRPDIVSILENRG
ncbi:uncharacterized protein LOC117100625 isoform X2 [Anneissia japonica]|uniref:uncharacterized protein LOC117100625 isoform X2 n=1 Tax=Anneissia japonica TaxID=1529436 RepID=UPI00142590DA|nr:uncharacterized protein LOC117100625 isoform X2 [Anneissia japonica]